MSEFTHLEAWIQREGEELLYRPDQASPDDQICFLPGMTRIPVHGEYGFMHCPLCGNEGEPLGSKTLSLCVLPSGDYGWGHAFFCEEGHEYFAWDNEYNTCDFGRHLEYQGTTSFGVRYLYSSERNTFQSSLFGER